MMIKITTEELNMLVTVNLKLNIFKYEYITDTDEGVDTINLVIFGDKSHIVKSYIIKSTERAYALYLLNR